MNYLLPHRRYNPLTGEWVLVSPHRTSRPWQGQNEDPPASSSHSYDPECYLCPGNKRASGNKNPAYKDPLVFNNDFPALLPGTPRENNVDPLFQAFSEKGICKVICYTPRHDLTLPLMTENEIIPLIKTWQTEIHILQNTPDINYVQLFENRGSIMGCSNPHPHCQIWASETIPHQPGLESVFQRKYFNDFGRCLLCDYIKKEIQANERIIIKNESFLVVVPFWAVWPFETLVLPVNHHSNIQDLTTREIIDLASILKRLTTRYDNLFQTSFPFSMGLHERPCDGKNHEEWHFHFHFYPPLLRSASIKKFMVGYELMANPQRDITPEQATQQLQKLSDIHYTSNKRDEFP